MRTIVFFFLLVWMNTSYGQNTTGLWTGVNATYQVTKDLRFSLEGQSRWDENLERLNKLYIAPEVRYDFGKYLRIASEYRISSVPFNSTTTNRTMAYRLGLDVEFRNIQKLISADSRWDLSLRARNTYEWEAEKMLDTYLRGKFEVAYDIKNSKLNPSLATEVFYHFSDRINYTFSSVKTVHAINKVRVTAGVDHPLGENQVIKGYFIFQPDLLDGSKEFILGLGYTYHINGR